MKIFALRCMVSLQIVDPFGIYISICQLAGRVQHILDSAAGLKVVLLLGLLDCELLHAVARAGVPAPHGLFRKRYRFANVCVRFFQGGCCFGAVHISRQHYKGYGGAVAGGF